MKTSVNPNSDDESSAFRKRLLKRFWRKFRSKYKTEKDCVEALYQIINDDKGVQCKYCGGHDIERKYGTRAGKCKDCRKKVCFTAGTFFSHIRSVRPFLAAILLLEKGLEFNASELHKEAEIAYSTAWGILKKLSIVIQSDLATESSAFSIFSAHFVAVFSRRSLETPAHEHPIAEQAEIERRELIDGQVDQSVITPSSASIPDLSIGMANGTKTGALGGLEKELLQILSTGPVHINELCEQVDVPIKKLSSTLMMLELEGLVVELPGGRYGLCTLDNSVPAHNPKHHSQSSNGDASANDSTINVAAAIDYIYRNFHGISRKYLQLYLSTYWCLVDRNRWSSGSLRKACRDFQAITHEEILAFVSPLLVKLMPC